MSSEENNKEGTVGGGSLKGTGKRDLWKRVCRRGSSLLNVYFPCRYGKNGSTEIDEPEDCAEIQCLLQHYFYD